jgi:phospholipid/cholesterol/gamma-HCH transport system substrate-binding protein
MSPRQRNVIVGIVVLVGLGIVTWMVLLFAGRVTQLFASPGIPIVLTAPRADGLSDGSAVYYLGVPVGRVTVVRRSDDNQSVVIDAQVNPKPPLPADLRGVIRMQGAFGSNATISLELTGPPAGTLSAGARLEAVFQGSGILPPEFTQLAVDLKRQELIKHLDETVMSIRQQGEKAGAVLESVQQVIGDPKMREDLRTAVTNIRSFTERADRIGQNFEKTSIDLQKVTDQSSAVMSDVRVAVAKLGNSLEHVQSVTAMIDQGKGTAGLFVNDPKLYQGLVDTTRELNGTIADLQRLIQQWEQEGPTIRLGK